MVRELELKDLGAAAELIRNFATRAMKLGSKFFADDDNKLINGFLEILAHAKMGHEELRQAVLVLVAEDQGQVYGILVAHLHRQYAYAKHDMAVYISLFEFMDTVSKIRKGRDLIAGWRIVMEWARVRNAGVIFGHSFLRDETARKLCRKLGMRPTYVRYELEVG